ncbi:Tn7 transposase TnsA N-terminal domain-containing protein [Marinicella meishanensis]|uniref:Tn7 transposase TnsA N-terminal domain-containing protein n=1 Tax=Marinicella meishanensis TaxID=2873263 RepID=UPI001CBBA3D3|nr:Tn7 transposase TnsA N-terminal domain-containing protein [Marinicella sp. NBU2979]
MNPIEIIDIQDVHQKLATIFSQDPIEGMQYGNRKIWKGLPNKNTVLFPSVKNQSLMPCESKLEAEHCLAIEFEKTTLSYRTQPLTLRLNRKQSYTPDVVMADENGEYTFREVKFSGSLESRKLNDRLTKITSIFATAGFRFEVVTEKVLNLFPDCQNRKYLYRSARLKFHQLQINEALSIIDTKGTGCSLHEFRNDCMEHGLNPLIADWAIFQGHVQFETQLPLNEKSLVWTIGDEA